MEPLEQTTARTREDQSLREWLETWRMVKVTGGGASYVKDAERFAKLDNVQTAIDRVSGHFTELAGQVAASQKR